eukprot:CAMPEP_0114232414 /NCGR_PEP_ID=MMETSP0058-20121206/4591_1 /TAXON_ID=36894 /ORGANISM="Pyramimonas parkeae, CCMP726" /LENGTH=426 /DNA_ID=CAMNT_0001343881 /DNA_START=197 /DNA_END=1478 /DNA_ORIENTATION=-
MLNVVTFTVHTLVSRYARDITNNDSGSKGLFNRHVFDEQWRKWQGEKPQVLLKQLNSSEQAESADDVSFGTHKRIRGKDAVRSRFEMRDTIREDVVPKLTINRNMMPSETAAVRADYRCLGPWCAEKGTWEFGMATDAENYRLEVEQTVERMQCASARSDALPPLRRLPVKLPVPLGASRTLITADDVFLTRANMHLQLQTVGSSMDHEDRTVGAALLPATLRRATGGDWGRCAAVGNSGVMVDWPHKFSHEIDAHDVVLRMNQAPTAGYGPYVGDKTTVRILSSLWAKQYKRGDVALSSDGSLELRSLQALKGESRDKVDAALQAWLKGASSAHAGASRSKSLAVTALLPLEKNSILICIRSLRGTDDCSALQKVLRRDRPDVRLLFLSPQITTIEGDLWTDTELDSVQVGEARMLEECNFQLVF